MGLFIPKKYYRPTLAKRRACKWCGVNHLTREMYKLRDGPIDWWFCNDEHALEWLDYRHTTPAIADMLQKLPKDRHLNGLTIDEWVSNELSQGVDKCAANPPSPV